jgi:hypothetical protein
VPQQSEGGRYLVVIKTVLDRGLGGLDLSCCDEAGKVIGNEIEGFLPSVCAPSFLSSLYGEFMLQIGFDFPQDPLE